MNKKYMKNTAILFASMTITKIVGAVFKIPLANILGGTGMGYFSTAYGLYSPVFALTAAGIPAVMMRLTAQNIAAGRPENALRTRRTALALFSVLGLAGTLVVALFSAFFAEHIACSPESTPAVIAISPAVMICCIASVLRGYHEGLSDVVPSAAAAVAEAVSRAAAGLALSYGVVFYAKYRFDNGLDVFGMQYADYSSAYAAALPYAAAGAIAAVSVNVWVLPPYSTVNSSAPPDISDFAQNRYALPLLSVTAEVPIPETFAPETAAPELSLTVTAARYSIPVRQVSRYPAQSAP